MADIKSYFEPEDMDGLANALKLVRELETSPTLGPVIGGEISRVMREYDRMRRKLEEITEGKSTMILSDADRALPIMDLSDEALVTWLRPTIVFLYNAQQKIADERDRAIDGLVGMNGVISLARITMDSGAARGSIKITGARDKDGEFGDWIVTIERVGAEFE